MGAGAQGALIFGGIFGGLILFSVIYTLISRAKGNLQVLTEKQKYEGGETVTGKVIVRTYKPVACRRLYIALDCMIRSSSGRNRSASTRAIYNAELPLSEQRQFPARSVQEYPFSFTLPDTAPYAANSIQLQNMDPAMAGLAHMTTQLQHKNARWQLRAHLEAEGVDLQSNKHFTVAFKQAENAPAVDMTPAIKGLGKMIFGVMLLFFLIPALMALVVFLVAQYNK